jgi:hypothetical protein
MSNMHLLWSAGRTIKYALRVKQSNESDEEAVNKKEFEFGSNSIPLPATPPPSLLNVAPFVLDVEGGQNGETYHALTCSLLTGNSGDVININIAKDQHEASLGQQDLLYFYSKKQLSNKNKVVQQRSLRLSISQKLFIKICRLQYFNLKRDYLNDSQLQNTQEDENYAQGYAYGSEEYAAKYWINRYLHLTDQERKLPKRARVGKVACLLVRRAHTAGDSRKISEGNIKQCLKAIRVANLAMKNVGYEIFTHIIFTATLVRERLWICVATQKKYAISKDFISPLHSGISTPKSPWVRR